METFQIIVSAITVIGAVFGSYLGVKVTITKLEGEDKRIESRVDGLDNRLTRVEDKVFE